MGVHLASVQKDTNAAATANALPTQLPVDTMNTGTAALVAPAAPALDVPLPESDDEASDPELEVTETEVTEGELALDEPDPEAAGDMGVTAIGETDLPEVEQALTYSVLKRIEEKAYSEYKIV